MGNSDAFGFGIFSNTHAHVQTFKISNANNWLSSAVCGIFYVFSPESKSYQIKIYELSAAKNLEPIQDAHLLTEKYFYCICSDSSLFRVSMEAKE